ncbi:MAG: glycosyltransferase [Algicola sp.]|nr:glycosyltransferase [Algicola sp.]
MQAKSSLLISTYNWPQALELVLKSVLNQSQLPDEVIVAEDGQDLATKTLIEGFKSKLAIPLIHISHEDLGFRKSVILNKAIAKAQGEYIIQVDGDCILHKHFIKDHLSFVQKNTYLYGSRVNIQEPYLETLFSQQKINFNAFSKGIKKRTRALYIPLFSGLFKTKTVLSSKYRGCNTSYFKSDAIAVNGYNEDIQGWGREDSEFALRLVNKGVLGRRLRYKGIVFHIFHVEKSKAQLKQNDGIEQQTILEKSIWCKNGIDKYLGESNETNT